MARCPSKIVWDAQFTYFTISSIGTKFSLRFLVKWSLECGGPSESCPSEQECLLQTHPSAPAACDLEMFEHEYHVQGGNKYWGRRKKCGKLVLDWMESHPECQGGIGYDECWAKCAAHLRASGCMPDMPFGHAGFGQDTNVSVWLPEISDQINKYIKDLIKRRKCKCKCMRPSPFTYGGPDGEFGPDPRVGFDDGATYNVDDVSQNTSFIAPDGRIKK